MYEMTTEFNRVAGASPMDFKDVTVQSTKLAEFLTIIASTLEDLLEMGMTIDEFDTEYKALEDSYNQ